jgi:hypothetical protein
MKKLIVFIVALFVSIGIATPPAFAVTQIWIGEFENCQSYAICRNMAPPDQLNIDLYDGRLNGQYPSARCADMGGVFGTRSGYGYVCRDVDY